MYYIRGMLLAKPMYWSQDDRQFKYHLNGSSAYKTRYKADRDRQRIVDYLRYYSKHKDNYALISDAINNIRVIDYEELMKDFKETDHAST